MIKISIHFNIRVSISRTEPRCHAALDSNTPLPPLPTTPSFYDTARQKVLLLGDSVSRSTRENYLTALRSLRRFAGGNLHVGDIDQPLLHRYERWLGERGVSRNTSSCYLRSLRSVLGRLMGVNSEPLFKGIYTGRASTDKRSVGKDTVKRLKQMVLPANSQLSLARDLFLFSFYAQGMPFVDMAFLRRQQVNSNRLVYHRHKTGSRIAVGLLPCMQDIIRRYESPSSDYVFPLLRSAIVTSAYDEYLTKLNWYNRTLKQLARRAGITDSLTSYTARHTWATTAYHSDVELSVISKALGHANPQTTMTYLREIDDHRLEEATRRIACSV